MNFSIRPPAAVSGDIGQIADAVADLRSEHPDNHLKTEGQRMIMPGSSNRPIITLLSDFGSLYPAEMKGAILSRTRDAVLVDISHHIPPQDIRAGAFALMVAARAFPEGTVHLAVVDPGVGTDRLSLVVESGGHLFVGPDNGLLIPAAGSLGSPRAWMIDPAFARDAAPTFHGRDVFAPAAAMLACGAKPQSFGPRVEPKTIDFGKAEVFNDGLETEVIYVDGFGNLILNAIEIPEGELVISGRRVRRVRTYAQAGYDEPLITIGSHGFAEIAVNGGSAKELFGLAPGNRIVLERENCSE